MKIKWNKFLPIALWTAADRGTWAVLIRVPCCQPHWLQRVLIEELQLLFSPSWGCSWPGSSVRLTSSVGRRLFFFFYTSKFFILLFQLIPIACFFFICTSAVRSSVVSVNKRVKGGLEPFFEFKWGRERCDSEHNGKTMPFLQGENTKRHSVSSFLFLWHLHTQVGWTWGLSSYTEITNIYPGVQIIPKLYLLLQ